MVRGINKLAPRISKLKAQLKVLQDAELWLCKEKWSAERELITPQIIPIGMTAKKKVQEEQSLTKRIGSMGADEAAELLAMLEARLGKEESD
jgi:flagellar motility protein MotE (MotC chaperone)